MTTNHINKLDDALTRPGRIDLFYEFKHITNSIINKICNVYIEDSIKLDQNLYQKLKTLNQLLQKD